ncbi:response regulator [Rhodoferax sp. PAMC 29310]|uniref:ATP-binding response regulator n=1 Tax=Rhodoferax sp. PAMC 29310 TaxID=2822760 RepID=UPI001B33AC4C|nr:response regulator [Rhodoferax sp. PAMC 29310]
MKVLDIRSRMLLAAVLPVTLIAVLLAALFFGARVDDLDRSHNQRARSLARQVATASEYGLFSANVIHLQGIALGGMREADVRSVAILDARGAWLASAGTLGYPLPVLTGAEGERHDSVRRTDLMWQPVVESSVSVDGLFDRKSDDAAPERRLLGHVVIEFSRESLDRREREMFLLGLAVTLAGVVLGALLATRLSRGVVLPILGVFDLVDRIGRGDLAARAAVLPDDPLRELRQGINQMAERLEFGRDELEQRVAAATVALREKKEEAESATLAKSRFLAAASHDLRQPIHALGMFVARLAQLRHDGDTQQLIGNIDASVRAMQDLLDGLLDISKLDAGAVKVQIRPVALGDLFAQLQSSLMLSAEEKGLRLRVRPTRAKVMSDPALLYRVLLNLLTNGLRYTRSGTVMLACRLSADQRLAHIEVRDSGIGIAPEHQSAVFKEFFQVGNSERDRSKGLGLGLNIVQRTVRLLGHELTLASAAGCGTRFRLTLALTQTNVPTSRDEGRDSVLFDELDRFNILVVEDDVLAREGLVALLTSWGAKVRQAESIAGALADVLLNGVPNLIVSDFRLRDGDNGLDCIRHLRAMAGHPIPACLISGNTDVALIQEAKNQGLILLHKPVRPAKLRSLVRRLALQAQTNGSGLK